jgi:hypothetical protein
MPQRSRTTFDTVLDISRAFPGTVEGTSYGTRAIRVGKKLIARLREDGETLVVICGFEERDLRMRARPDVFFNLPHYYGYPTVLVSLPRISRKGLREVLEVAWRRSAPRKLVAEHDGRRG